jgi:hypothetical protein
MPAYTTCVLPEDYVNPPLPAEGTTGATVQGIGLSLHMLEETCDYMLHGKLVCLGGDRCAVGHVAGFETVADKSFPDNIDNDFSINVLLSPWDLGFFTDKTRLEGYTFVANDPQGVLIREQSGMPYPRESEPGQLPSEHYSGTFVTFPDKGWIDYNPPEGIRGVPFDVPVIHCEIEGERAHLVCETLDKLLYPLPGMKSFCKKNILTKILCKVAQWFMTPAIAPAIAYAWAAGANDNRDYQGGGSLARGDLVAIGGRWVYDAGHGGYNELHPVKTIQKLPEDSAIDPSDFDRWCKRISEGTAAGPLTAEQQPVADEQRKPWSRWVLHPFVDGCVREEEEEEEPYEIPPDRIPR